MVTEGGAVVEAKHPRELTSPDKATARRILTSRINLQGGSARVVRRALLVIAFNSSATLQIC